ncbi:MAG: hypothetical protein KDD62_14140, partial [Bdellovibrionales bacterium]|nr:hypothetical protein [Bdellovibrionales bacterium]
RYAPFQMSCFTDNEAGKDYHWCQECTVCTKMYLLCVGGGVDPKEIGLTKQLLSNEYRELYPLFGADSKFSYLRTSMARDEQLFSFYCATKLGCKEGLVLEFANSALYEEAESRFDELYKQFCSFYDPLSVPPKLLPRLKHIFNEELTSFNF